MACIKKFLVVQMIKDRLHLTKIRWSDQLQHGLVPWIYDRKTHDWCAVRSWFFFQHKEVAQACLLDTLNVFVNLSVDFSKFQLITCDFFKIFLLEFELDFWVKSRFFHWHKGPQSDIYDTLQVLVKLPGKILEKFDKNRSKYEIFSKYSENFLQVNCI